MYYVWDHVHKPKRKQTKRNPTGKTKLTHLNANTIIYIP